MLSLTELQRAVRIVDARLSGAVLEKITQPDEHTIVLTFHRQAVRENLLLSCHPDLARLSLIERAPKAPGTPLPLAQYLRAHFTRARFGGARILGEDRQAGLRLEGRERAGEVLLSILGARSNLYVLNGGGTLLQFLRPLEQTRRELAVGRPFVNPATGVKSPGIERWATEPDESYLAAIERTYQEIERDKQLEERSRKISQALAKESVMLERKKTRLQDDLGAASRAEEYHRQGELLKSVLHKIRPGLDAVCATDHETGQDLTIALDPRLSPAANLAHYFDRYHKELRKRKELERQLDALQAERGELAELEASFRALMDRASPDLQALISFAELPQVRKLLTRHYPTRRTPAALSKQLAGKKRIPARLQPKRYRSIDGLEIWVGRSDAGNDFLTTRLSRGNDLFFHLEGSPGSHVILRTEGRKDPPPESLLDAGELAAHFSKQKDAKRADVHVAAIKHVKKPPGVKPGLVYVTRGKTIHLRRDPKRLQRLLAARLDD